FAAALSAGASGSELDVRMTSDHVLVCAHDASVDIGGERRRVCDVTASQMAALGAATLSGALRTLASAIAVVEIKNQPWDACYDATFAIASAVADAVPPGAI